MTPQDVLKKYGSQYRFQKDTGMSHATLGNWLNQGTIPETAQAFLEKLTKGELKLERKSIAKENENVIHAKKHLRYYIRFFQSLLSHLSSKNSPMLNNALLTTYFLHDYVSEKLPKDIETHIKKEDLEK